MIKIKKMKKLFLVCACTLLSITIFAQSTDLEKFKTFYKIKDSVTSFDPLKEIIDCGFRQLTANPLDAQNASVVTTLTSNTSTGLKVFRDRIQYGAQWATHVEQELAKKLNDKTLSVEAKAAFELVKVVLAMNTLPVTAMLTPQHFYDIRKKFDTVYKIYPSLPYMLPFEEKFDMMSYNFLTRDERIKSYKLRANFKNEQVSNNYKEIYKEHNEPFEMSFTSFSGKKVDLKNLKGKVVLVDFWATWCGPCVAEMPHVKEVYKKYHERGFEVIGISLDDNETRLKEYLTKNEIPWEQFFDGKGWKNELAVKHGITGVPTAYLLDRNGVIYTKQGRAEELDEAMKELFDKK